MRILSILFVSLLGFNPIIHAAVASCMELTHADGLKKNICDKNDQGFLVLEFIMPKCGACLRNVAKFKQLEERNKSLAHSRIISIGNLDNALNFRRNNNISTDIAVDDLSEARRAFNIRRVPAVIILDNNNQIIYEKTGLLNDNDINSISDLITLAPKRSLK